ncbi:MAG: hypothetical protein JWQ78_1441, partial [Sediminibacterium sp.]|nr:hypothetical protein [Sediminibacterium sp.]
LYIIEPQTGTIPPAPVNPVGATDLAAWVYSDVAASSLTTGRSINFNVFNIGGSNVPPSGWGIYYLYYNAFNANDYNVIFNDNFSTAVAGNTFVCSSFNKCDFNFTLAKGGNFAQAVFNQNSVFRQYTMPNITGQYYLVLIVDPGNILNDVNRQNNLFYTTAQAPKSFINGVSLNAREKPGGFLSFINPDSATHKNLFSSHYNTAITIANRNAYSPDEIMEFINMKIKNGELKRKIEAAGVLKPGGH